MEKKIRIFLSETLEENSKITLNREQSHYINNVMRLDAGRELLLFNGIQGEFLGSVSSHSKKETIISLRNKTREQSKSKNILLAFCPLKGQRLDFLIQKCTELGLKSFVPVISDHTINRKINKERLKKIIIESCEQSDQLCVPDLLDSLSFKDFTHSLGSKEIVLFADINSSANNLKELVQSNKESKFILLVGPEGDFSSKERMQIKKDKRFKNFSLGKNILRSETAAIASLVLLNYLLN
jgi:16S rRNA (uracil1498-N3)-methyltransferase